MSQKLSDVIAQRLFKNMFICIRCGAKIRANPLRVKESRVNCRKCGSKKLRLKAKERRGAKV